MSEYTIYLRQGVTALVLAMIEDGAIDRDLVLADPVRSIREVSHDPSCRLPLVLDNGKKRTAVEIQAEYVELAQAYAASTQIDPMFIDIIEKWAFVVDALGRDPMELDTRIDWVIKKAMIEGFIERKRLDWSAPQVQMLDLQYHDTRPEKGLYHLLEKQGRVERIVSDEEILWAIHHPPVDTRAYFRGECLRRFPEQVFGVNWDSISFGIGDEPIKRIMMNEPLKGSKEHVGDLLERSANAAELMKNLSA
jgi:proteasome accessory factor A